MDAVEIYEKCVPSVVSIQADGEGEYSTGTGVVMSADGYILTNAHVVADSLRMSVLLSDGRVMEARLVGADAGEDLAATNKAVYFWNPEIATCKWINRLNPYMRIGNHVFAK